MTAAIRLVDPRPVEHALSETSSAAPHWSIHTDPLEHTASAALVGEPYDPERDPYRLGWLAGQARWWLWFASGAVFGGAVIGVVHGLINRLG